MVEHDIWEQQFWNLWHVVCREIEYQSPGSVQVNANKLLGDRFYHPYNNGNVIFFSIARQGFFTLQKSTWITHKDLGTDRTWIPNIRKETPKLLVACQADKIFFLDGWDICLRGPSLEKWKSISVMEKDCYSTFIICVSFPNNIYSGAFYCLFIFDASSKKIRNENIYQPSRLKQSIECFLIPYYASNSGK